MKRPTSIRVRMYTVGFGDAFLLTFRYAGEQRRHVLVDLGTTHSHGHSLADVAQDIVEQCKDDPVAIVATHRHKDHIAGFQGEPWERIKRLRVVEVIRPWTDDPALPADATAPIEPDGTGPGHARALMRMQDVAARVLALAARPEPGSASAELKALRERIRFIADDNLPNQAAIDNLESFGDRCRYVKFGAEVMREHLPGVKVHVLGPPTTEQHAEIKKYAKRSEEYWSLRALLGDEASKSQQASDGGPPLEKRRLTSPLHTAWIRSRLTRLRNERWLNIVTAIDRTMNNTSVILLFEVGNQKLLFPGDAQVENWAYALSQPGVRELLEGVTLYKVGHHGSLNATPRSMWDAFKWRGDAGGGPRLHAMLSTLKGVHGKVESHTEVPRRRLVRALEQDATLLSTERNEDLSTDLEVEL